MNSIQATVLLGIITISGNVLEIMADVPKIKDLASVIEPHLNGTKLVNYTSRYLTKPGDNYGGLLLAIAAKVQKPSGEIEELPLVAKLPPITNQYYWDKYNPEISSRKEIEVYENIAPQLRLLQFECGIQENDIFDGFAKYYGSRTSLNPNSTEVDRDAVLVLENLQTSGFKPGSRQIPFNMVEIKLILPELAKFHALNLKLLELTGEAKSFQEVSNELGQEYDASSAEGPENENLFMTIALGDLWKNNIMLKYDESGQPIKVKFIDFQAVLQYSCASDVTYLLFTSAEIPVLEYHFDELLHLYYDAFIKSLKSVYFSTDQYSYAGFMTEINEHAPVRACDAILGVATFYVNDSVLPSDFKDVNDEDIIRDADKNPKVLERMANIRRIAKKYNIDLNNCY